MIAWYDNIPVLSFILLGGKCRNCRKPISWQYPIVELVTGILFLLVFSNNFQFSIFNFQTIFNFQFSNFKFFTSNFLLLISIFRDWFIIAVMIVIFVIDLRWYLILDAVTMPAAAVIFFLNLALGMSWQNMLMSGIIGGSFFLIQFVISKGKWIGGGDIRLGFLMGLALGWPNVLTAIFLAYFIGSIFGIGLILSGEKKWKSKIPLGTFLAVATIITLLWGEKILGWYLSRIFNF
jgi:prepilin signal peptidase PulO-like enzyme (type II secretory pathway)